MASTSVSSYEVYHNEQGQKYYYNTQTGVSTWTLPDGAKVAESTASTEMVMMGNPVIAAQTLQHSSTPSTDFQKPVLPSYASSSVSPAKLGSSMIGAKPASLSVATTPMSQHNVPKSSWNKRHLKIAAGIVLLTAVIAIVVAAAVILTRKSSSNNSTAQQQANSALDVFVSQSYDPAMKMLSLSPAAFQNSAASGLLNTLFSSELGNITFLNSVLHGDISATQALETLLQEFGVPVPQLLDLLQSQLAARVFTGQFSTAGATNFSGGVLSNNAQCLVAVFYQVDSTTFAFDALQFAIQCTLDASWTPADIPTLPVYTAFSTSPSTLSVASQWISQFQFIGQAQLVLSTLDYQYIAQVAANNSVVQAELSALPQFLHQGINIFAQVKTVSQTAGAALNGLDALLTTPLPHANSITLQFSLPLVFTFATSNSSGGLNLSAPIAVLANDAPIRGSLQVNGSAINIPGSTVVGAGSVTVVIEGTATGVTSVYVQGNVTLAYKALGTNGLNAWVVGKWNTATNLVLLDGFIENDWTPFTPESGAVAPPIVVVSGLQISVNLSVSAGSVSLNFVEFNGTSTFYYSNQPTQPAYAVGLFTQTQLLLAIQDLTIGNIANLVSTLISLSSSSSAAASATTNVNNAFTYLQQQIPQWTAVSGGTVDFSISNFPTQFFAPVLATVPQGVSLTIQGLTINTNAFGGQITSFVQQLDPAYNAVFDLSLALPFQPVYGQGFQPVANTPVTFSLLASNVVIGDFDLETLQLSFSAPTTGSALSIAASAVVQFSVPDLSSKPLVINAALQYNQATKFFSFSGALQGTITPTAAKWLSVSNLNIAVQVNTSAPQTAYSVALGANLQFHYSSTVSTGIIPVQLTIVNNIFVFSATGISIASIYPPLASYVGLAANQPINLVVTNANGQSPITVTNIATSFSSKVASPSELISLSPLLANLPSSFSLALPGVNLFATEVPLAGGSSALSLLGATSLNGVKLNFTAFMPLSLSQEWQVTVDTAAPIKISTAFTLSDAIFDFDIVPSPLSVSTDISAQMALTIPYNPTLTFGVTGAYASASNNLTLTGSLSAWPNPFGVPFLSVGATTAQFEAYSYNGGAYHAGSLGSSVSFLNGPSVQMCGALFENNVAFTVDNVGVATFENVLCQVLGVCTAGVFNSSIFSPLNSISFGINIATAAITPAAEAAYTPVCTLPNSISAGISITTQVDLQGIVKQVLGNLWNGFESFASALVWDFITNLPFAGTTTQSYTYTGAVARAVVDSKLRALALNPSHPALVGLSKEILAQRAVYLQSLSGVSALNFAYQNTQLSFPLTSWFTITGVGVSSNVANLQFSLWTSFKVTLKNNTSPLFFYVSGAYSQAEVVLTGTLQTAFGGWVNPFGINGLTVYNVGAQVGFGGTTGLTRLGLGFSAKFGPNIVVSFAGSVSIASTDSYLTGSVSSANGQALTLLDVCEAANQLSNGKIPVPGGLPPASVLSLTQASFTIATGFGVDLNGNSYSPGFYFSAVATILGISVNTQVGTVQRSISGVPVMDFVFNLELDFTVWNDAIIGWISKLIPFDQAAWKAANKTLCEIACVNYIAIQNFSVVDMLSLQKFPTVSLEVTVLSKAFSWSFALDYKQMANTFLALLESIESQFVFNNLCVTSSTCPSGDQCDHLTWKCVASCPGPVLPLIGCV